MSEVVLVVAGDRAEGDDLVRLLRDRGIVGSLRPVEAPAFGGSLGAGPVAVVVDAEALDEARDALSDLDDDDEF